MTRRIFLATPTYSGNLSVEYVGSLLANLADLTARGIVPDVNFLPGLCYVALARNQQLSMFLDSGASDLVFIDDDVGFPPDAIYRLLRHDREVVAGVYPQKRDDQRFPVRLLPGACESGLLECEGLPTGFMRIRRDVIERMIERMPERVFVDLETGDRHYNFFSCEQVGQTWWGEDYRFCQLARSIGVRLWCDPDIDFRHVGRNVWRGNLKVHLDG